MLLENVARYEYDRLLKSLLTKVSVNRTVGRGSSTISNR